MAALLIQFNPETFDIETIKTDTTLIPKEEAEAPVDWKAELLMLAYVQYCAAAGRNPVPTLESTLNHFKPIKKVEIIKGLK